MNYNRNSDSRPKQAKKPGPRVKFDLGPEEMVSHVETEMRQQIEKYTEMSACEGSEVHLETEVAEEPGTSSDTETSLHIGACQEDSQGTEPDQSSQTNKNSEHTQKKTETTQQSGTTKQNGTIQQTETKELCMDCRQSYGSGQDNHDFVLRMAIYSDHAECVRALIREGADVNHKLNARLVHDVVISGQDDCL